MKYSWVLFLICIQCTAPKENPCPSKTCKDFVTQAQAQQAFDADKKCLNSLDNDNDGTACEELLTNNGSASGTNGGGSTTGCPTTANCGCSNKTKNVCESTCCKWVVGEGCKCR